MGYLDRVSVYMPRGSVYMPRVGVEGTGGSEHVTCGSVDVPRGSASQPYRGEDVAHGVGDLVEGLFQVGGDGEHVAGVAHRHLLAQVDAHLVVVRGVQRGDAADARGVAAVQVAFCESKGLKPVSHLIVEQWLKPGAFISSYAMGRLESTCTAPHLGPEARARAVGGAAIERHADV
jgi:hypothetical protein